MPKKTYGVRLIQLTVLVLVLCRTLIPEAATNYNNIILAVYMQV